MSKLILPTPLSDKNFNYFKFLISNLTSLWKKRNFHWRKMPIYTWFSWKTWEGRYLVWLIPIDIYGLRFSSMKTENQIYKIFTQRNWIFNLRKNSTFNLKIANRKSCWLSGLLPYAKTDTPNQRRKRIYSILHILDSFINYLLVLNLADIIILIILQ